MRTARLWTTTRQMNHKVFVAIKALKTFFNQGRLLPLNHNPKAKDPSIMQSAIQY